MEFQNYNVKEKKKKKKEENKQTNKNKHSHKNYKENIGTKLITNIKKHNWRRKWQPTPVFLPGESQGWGACWAAVYGVVQSQTQLK